MSRRWIFPLLVFLLSGFTAAGSWAREWTDTEGRLLIRGEVFAADRDTLVVKKENGDLIGLRVDELSAEDREFLRLREEERTREATPPEQEPVAPVAAADPREGFQEWTTRDGFTFQGHAIGFGREDLTISRESRLISVDGTAFTNLDPVAQYVVLRTVAELDDPAVKTERDLNEWLRRQEGVPRIFPVEGVLMRVKGGERIVMPFFVFTERDQAVLRPGWEQWKSDQASEAERRREDFLMSVDADTYARDREEARRIQMMQTELLAASTGVTTIWEVTLLPRPGVFARPLAVLVSARTSFDAQRMALGRFPGYVVGPTRSISR